MCKLTIVLIFSQILFTWGGSALAEDYSECRLRCETEYIDCTNASPAPEPEVQAAKMASCDSAEATCYAECENFKPVEVPEGVENNPNIIRK